MCRVAVSKARWKQHIPPQIFFFEPFGTARPRKRFNDEVFPPYGQPASTLQERLASTSRHIGNTFKTAKTIDPQCRTPIFIIVFHILVSTPRDPGSFEELSTANGWSSSIQREHYSILREHPHDTSGTRGHDLSGTVRRHIRNSSKRRLTGNPRFAGPSAAANLLTDSI